MREVVETGWGRVLSLLIAVATALLFVAPQHAPALERDFGDEQLAPSQPELPVVSRVRESLDRTARRDDTDPFTPHALQLELVETHAFGAWPLPEPCTSPRSRLPGGGFARGPPALA